MGVDLALEALVKAYERRPGLAAQKAAWHRQQAELCHQRGEPDHEVHHYDRADNYEAVLDRLVRCRRCGRELTDPVSIERKIGPECYRRDARAQTAEPADQLPLNTGTDPL
jgi:hypothetical protein